MSANVNPEDLIVPRNYGVAGQPHAVWTELRKNEPVYRCEAGDYQPFWAITRHADIMDISGRPEIFSNADGITILNSEGIRAMENRNSSPLGKMRTIIEMDPPEHRDFRKVASGFFTKRNIQGLDEIVARSAREIVDSLGEEGECDFIDKVGQRHPLRVLATLLGIDEEDEERVLELTQQLFGGDDPDLQREAESREQAMAELGLEFYQLFDRIVQDRRANPRDDLASLLANAKMDGDFMGPVETFGYYLIVFTAGHDTTRNALSGGVEALIQHPDQFERLRKHPEHSKKAVEEVVRWTSPVNYMKRRVLSDQVIRGQKIPAGDDIVLFYASANRDEEVFENPFEFDIFRTPNRHLGFGTGEHFCLGAHVARMSARALLVELATRVEELTPTAPSTHIESSFVCGLKTLPVRYRIRPAA